MSHVQLQSMAVALLFVGLSFADEPPTRKSVDDAKSIEGLWSGSWGGGGRDGVVFQPVLAEMVIQGDKVELWGFRNANRFSGTVRVDTTARQLRMAPKDSDLPATKTLDYTYEIKGDKLTLIDSDKTSVQFQKQARGLIRKSTVVVAFRDEDQLPPPQNHGLWKNLGRRNRTTKSSGGLFLASCDRGQ